MQGLDESGALAGVAILGRRLLKEQLGACKLLLRVAEEELSSQVVPLYRLINGLMRHEVLIRLRACVNGGDSWLLEKNLFVELWLDGGTMHFGNLQQIIVLVWLDLFRLLLGKGCLALLFFRVET